MGNTFVVSLSGGMDSATILSLVYSGKHATDKIITVGFNYGSKHNSRELECAKMLALAFSCEFQVVDLTEAMHSFKSNLLIGQGKIPEGHYEAPTMEQTVVPARNIIFASVLAGIAWSRGANAIYLGIHAGDHAIYPDCRPDFFVAMRNAVLRGTGERVALQAPFLHMTKKEILQMDQVRRLNTPYTLTRTCYKDQDVACGKCGSCQERLAAFAALELLDPLQYESRELLPKEGT